MSAPALTFCVPMYQTPWSATDSDRLLLQTPVKDRASTEIVMALRLLELAKRTGVVLHFFLSCSVLEVFPSVSEAILNEGHALDGWIEGHPSRMSKQFHRVQVAMRKLGISVEGLALEEGSVELSADLKFQIGNSSADGSLTWTDLPAIQSRLGFNQWMNAVKALSVADSSPNCVRLDLAALRSFDTNLIQLEAVFKAVAARTQTLRSRSA